MAIVSSRRPVLHLHHLRPFSSSPSPSPPLAAGDRRPSTRPAARPAVDPAILKLARSRQFSTIESLLDRRTKSPKASTEPYLASLILNYAAANMLDQALATFAQSPAPRTLLSFNTLLSCCNRSRHHIRKVPDLFADLSTKHSITPDEVSYGILIKSLCRAGGAKKATPILKEMETKKIEVTTVTYTTIIDSLYKEKKPEEAEKLWQEMVRKGCVPDLPAYNVRIMHRAQHGKPGDVLSLIDEMETAGMKPDTITYNYLMACYCSHGRITDALKVYKGLKEKRCGANALTYKILLATLCKREQFDEAVGVFSDCMKDGKVPDLGTVKLLVEGLMKREKVKEAKKVVRWLNDKYPDEFTGDWKKLEKVVGLNKEEKAVEEDKALEGEEPVAA